MYHKWLRKLLLLFCGLIQYNRKPKLEFDFGKLGGLTFVIPCVVGFVFKLDCDLFKSNLFELWFLPPSGIRLLVNSAAAAACVCCGCCTCLLFESLLKSGPAFSLLIIPLRLILKSLTHFLYLEYL